MKRFLLNLCVSLALVISYIGIYPTSWFTSYQPEVPEELLR
ncbi:cyclic lactone autoinducer peptide [Desulforamulus ruminis]|uniref:Cyclic lactone autoinducer peptide n=1 Tax=Desulforamulus ruminis (strain ATCC 23193 / DSM 2154 / NCIMB 8452 / DL) TaxID=696281 RepID=F6DSJ4_DESRL|nr:cyclic lactone autoinducer peptide [Desulforamulus ruminis]AEG61084.1 hypothetical protein Desru_2870 [Desulforamulus ruminis DSM 2154]